MIPALFALTVLAATLGAGGYLFYRMLDRRLGELASILVEAGVGTIQEIRGVGKCLARRPDRAQLVPASGPLVDVEALKCIVGTEVIPAGAERSIIVAPTRCDAFKGHAIRVLVHAAGHPSIEQRAYLGAVEINCLPQWEMSGVQDIPTDVLAAPAGKAVPIKLTGTISSAGLIQVLIVKIRNDNPNPIRATVEIYGEPSAMQLAPSFDDPIDGPDGGG